MVRQLGWNHELDLTIRTVTIHSDGPADGCCQYAAPPYCAAHLSAGATHAISYLPVVDLEDPTTWQYDGMSGHLSVVVECPCPQWCVGLLPQPTTHHRGQVHSSTTERCTAHDLRRGHVQ